MFETFLASQAGSSFFGGLGQGLLAGDPGNAISGATVDARGHLDGSGWTVSTGRSSATGATQTKADPFGPSITAGGASQAGMGMLPALLLLAVVGGLLLTSRKG